MAQGEANRYRIDIHVKGLGSEPVAKKELTAEQKAAKEAAEARAATIQQLKKVGKTAAGAAVAYGTQILTYQVGRVGVETGNYRKQAEYSAFLSVGLQAFGIGAAMYANPLLGTIALGGLAINEGLKYRTYNYERTYEGAMLSVQRERAGIGFLSTHMRG